jgi:DNA-binding transcriptional MerR regulator
MFRIGEFSHIAQVSGRLLRYYDEIGMLSPAYTDPQTGYRYYSAAQLPRLNRILVLKELGVGLDQIAQLLGQDTSSEEIRGMLLLRKAQITQTMQDDLARLYLVEARLDQMDAFGQTPVPDVVVKTIPPPTLPGTTRCIPRRCRCPSAGSANDGYRGTHTVCE